MHNRDVNAAQRANTAIQLRAAGHTYAEVAQRCGYSDAGSARNAVLREMERTIVKNVDELRDVELDRLERMHNVAWEMMMDEGNKGRLFAIDRLLAISERRSKLMGLDIPTSTNIAANQIIVREVPQGYLGEKSAE